MNAYRLKLARNIVLSGGIDDEAHAGAKTLFPMVTTEVPVLRVFCDTSSMNTQNQASWVLAMAKEWGWHSFLLVASPNHMPRAFLTFVRTFDGEAVRMAPLFAPVSWWGVPDGGASTRLDLLEVEYEKAERYSNDVATWAEGLAFLKARA